MATFTISFFDINDDQLNSGFSAYTNSSEHDFTIKFKAYHNEVATPFDRANMHVEIGEEEFTGEITAHGENWTFDGYPCRFDASDLDGLLSIDPDTGIYSMQLPFGSGLDLGRESISVPAIPVSPDDQSAGTLQGMYYLMTQEEASEAIGTSINSYKGYARIYCRETNDGSSTSYMYIRAHGTDSARRWCISSTAKDDPEIQSGAPQYIIKSSTVTTSYETWPGDSERPDIEMSFYTRSSNDQEDMGDNIYQAAFGHEEPEDEHDQEKTFYIRIGDGTNTTGVITVKLKIWQVPPSNVNLMLTGSSGNRNYTGFRKKDGRFFPSQYVKAAMSASSSLPMRCRLAGPGVAANRTGSVGAQRWTFNSPKRSH